MEWLISNSFLIVVLLVCVGMHVFGHGHGHGKGRGEDHSKKGQDHGNSFYDNSEKRD